MSASLHKFKQHQQAFSEYIRTTTLSSAVSNLEDRRLKIYRELFFNNVEGFVSSAFPVLNEILNDDQWEVLVRDFFVTHPCDTPYFLKISEEFLQYLEYSKLDFLPVFSYQLAHWEWMELFADVAETGDESEELPNITLTDTVTTNDCTWNVGYDFSVHKISSDYIPEEAEATFLIVHRDSDLSVGFIEINPLSMLLFEQLKNNENTSVQDLLRDISEQQDISLDVIMQGGLDIIRQWGLIGLLKVC
jgi:hypothetical protein